MWGAERTSAAPRLRTQPRRSPEGPFRLPPRSGAPQPPILLLFVIRTAARSLRFSLQSAPTCFYLPVTTPGESGSGGGTPDDIMRLTIC